MGWLCILPIVAVASQALNNDDGHFVDELILGNNKISHLEEIQTECISMSESDNMTFDSFHHQLLSSPAIQIFLGHSPGFGQYF